MSIDERIRAAGSRLGEMPVTVPSLEGVLHRRRQRTRVGLSAAMVVLVAAAGAAWLVPDWDHPSALNVTAGSPSPAPTGHPDRDAVATYDLTLRDAVLVDEETLTARNTDVVLWFDESTEAYLSLTVRPGLAASSPTPAGLGVMTEDETFPPGEGRAWFSDATDSRTSSTTMWWTRSDGDVWLLHAYWYGAGSVSTPDGMQVLREWALGIGPGSTPGQAASLEAADPMMARVDSDESRDVRSRSRVWRLQGHDVTLLTIEDSAAAGMSNLVALGPPLRRSAAGQDAWMVVGGPGGDTIIGWRLDTPTEAWVTLTIPAELVEGTDEIVGALQAL